MVTSVGMAICMVRKSVTRIWHRSKAAYRSIKTSRDKQRFETWEWKWSCSCEIDMLSMELVHSSGVSAASVVDLRSYGCHWVAATVDECVLTQSQLQQSIVLSCPATRIDLNIILVWIRWMSRMSFAVIYENESSALPVQTKAMLSNWTIKCCEI